MKIDIIEYGITTVIISTFMLIISLALYHQYRLLSVQLQYWRLSKLTLKYVAYIHNKAGQEKSPREMVEQNFS